MGYREEVKKISKIPLRVAYVKKKQYLCRLNGVRACTRYKKRVLIPSKTQTTTQNNYETYLNNYRSNATAPHP